MNDDGVAALWTPRSLLDASSHLYTRVCPSVTVKQKRRFEPGSTLRSLADPWGSGGTLFFYFSVRECRDTDWEGIVQARLKEPRYKWVRVMTPSLPDLDVRWAAPIILPRPRSARPFKYLDVKIPFRLFFFQIMRHWFRFRFFPLSNSILFYFQVSVTRLAKKSSRFRF